MILVITYHNPYEELEYVEKTIAFTYNFSAFDAWVNKPMNLQEYPDSSLDDITDNPFEYEPLKEWNFL